MSSDAIMVRKLFIVFFALVLLPVLFIAYFFVDSGLIQPWKHSRNTKNGETINETELSNGSVKIHQLAFWVEFEGTRIKVWSELACARKFRTSPRTLKATGYSRFTFFGLNDADVRFRISKELDFVAKAKTGSICNLVANLERELPIALKPYTYDVLIEPAAQSCDRYLSLLQTGAFSSRFGPLQVRSTRTVPMNEVFSRRAYAPDAVDASLSDNNESPLPDIKTHIDTLDRNRCN